MKQIKAGFSLAELLIGLVIAAIIATMGMSIAKKGIENSYDAYIYTGYKGISDAIAEANADGHTLTYNNIGNCEFTDDILNMFNVDPNKIEERTNTSIKFTTPNNITYLISQGGTTGSVANDNLKEYYTIRIWFPTANVSSPDNRRNAEFVYAPQDEYGVLLPIPQTEPAPGTEEYTKKLWNLAKRKDLLMFYIDDGQTGRYDAKGNYTKRTYYSLNDALCRAGKKVGVTSLPVAQIDPGTYHPFNKIINNQNALINNQVNLDKYQLSLKVERILIDRTSPGAHLVNTPINDCSSTEFNTTNGVIKAANPRKG